MTDTAESQVVEPELAPATNVIEGIARVMATIGGIKKLTPQQRQRLGMSGGDAQGITYAYRSIDQLAQHAQPLFGMHGVVIVPNVVDEQTVKILKGSGAGASLETTPWTRTRLEVEWSIYGPGGVTDKITSLTVGLADDNSDKAVNKGMTAAFKNLLLRILCIGDPQDDADGLDSNAPGEYRDPAPKQPFGKILFDQIKASGDDRLKVLLRQFGVDHDKKITEKMLVEDEEWARQVAEAIEGYQAAQAQDAVADSPEPNVTPPADTTPEAVAEEMLGTLLGATLEQPAGTEDMTTDQIDEVVADKVKPGSASRKGK